MDLDELCISIGLSKEASQLCKEFSVSKKELAERYCALQNNAEKFLDEENAKPNAPQRLLALFMRFALLAYEEYKNRLISKQIFLDTFADIALWEQEHFAVNATHGISETEWLAKHVCLRVFRLGSLQFEPTAELPPELTLHEKLPPAFYMHVPKGADISNEAVLQSCEFALRFFKVNSMTVLCHSWLLSPVLAELLPNDSRILRYASRFQILRPDYECRQAEERIFGKICESAHEYPCDTSLQNSAKKYLLKGNSIPSAEGYFIF